MFRTTTKRWFAKSRPESKTIRKTRLSILPLEERAMPAVTDMTAVAQQFGRHAGPTNLFINFDGATNIPSHNITAFTGTAADRAEILYRVSEMYAPFDVTVSRWEGASSYAAFGGATTVFVGDDTGQDQAITLNIPNVGPTLVGFKNASGGITDGKYSDAPYLSRGTNHQPNSDPFDIAFVDPVQNAVGALDRNLGRTNVANLAIAQTIAHEAGHTFGLSHVLTAPTTEVMSYNSTNAFFSNQTFAIAAINNSASGVVPAPQLQPVWMQPFMGTVLPFSIVTQNSFTYMQATLGNRGPHGPRVVDRNAVDTSVYNNFAATSSIAGFSDQGLLGKGDYRVYQFQASGPWGDTVSIDLASMDGGDKYTPQLLIFNGAGAPRYLEPSKLHTDIFGQSTLHTELQVLAGQTFQLVVGDVGANDPGTYRLYVNSYRTNFVLNPNNPFHPPVVQRQPDEQPPRLPELPYVPRIPRDGNMVINPGRGGVVVIPGGLATTINPDRGGMVVVPINTVTGGGQMELVVTPTQVVGTGGIGRVTVRMAALDATGATPATESTFDAEWFTVSDGTATETVLVLANSPIEQGWSADADSAANASLGEFDEAAWIDWLHGAHIGDQPMLVLYGAALASDAGGIATPAAAAAPQMVAGQEYVAPQTTLNENVLAFALANLGQTVGDGECWSLVHEALTAAGADTSGDGAYVFGSAIGPDSLATGDVLQFEGVHFEGADPETGGTYWQDFGHHTAIVYGVEGNQITLLNQNVNGDRTVQFTIINLADWQGGDISAYHPQSM